MRTVRNKDMDAVIQIKKSSSSKKIDQNACIVKDSWIGSNVVHNVDISTSSMRHFQKVLSGGTVPNRLARYIHFILALPKTMRYVLG
jgi:hypothetical protein